LNWKALGFGYAQSFDKEIEWAKDPGEYSQSWVVVDVVIHSWSDLATK
jgi:hypothetical protein